MDIRINEPRGARRARSDTLARSPRGETRHWQIGPRIRVGGTLGKVGQNVKIATGKALSNPIVDGALALIPGVGPGLSAAAGAMGRIYDTSNGGLHGLSGLGSLAAGGAKGYAAGMAGNALRGGIGSLVHGAGSVGTGVKTATAAGSLASPHGAASVDADPYGDGDPTNFNAVAGGAAGGAGGGGGFMDYAKKLLAGGGKDGKGNMGELGDIMGRLFGGGGGGALDALLAGGSIAASAADKQRQQGFQDKAAAYATGDYDKNAPIRDAGRTLALDRSTPDLSSLFANPGNVYDAQRRGMPLGQRVPVKSQY